MSDNFFGEINPPQRLLMGPGPVNVHPRVLRAMSADMLGQFDPEMTEYMNQTMALYRQVFMTKNRWTFLIDGTARAGIEAALTSLIEPGARVLIVRAGRFGMLLSEIAERLGADIRTLDLEWGQVATLKQIEAALAEHKPAVFATIHGDTSTTTAQPLDGVGALCHQYGALSYVDATATLGGMPVKTDEWGIDIVTGGLQKCMGGPPGSAPITISDRAAEFIFSRRKVESGIKRDDISDGTRPFIRSNYFDLAMIMDYWSEKRLNHHTEATSMLYAARECARDAGRGATSTFRPPRGGRCRHDGGAARVRPDCLWSGCLPHEQRDGRLCPARCGWRTRAASDARGISDRNRHGIRAARRENLAHRRDGLQCRIE